MNDPSTPETGGRQTLELLQSAQARFETVEAAVRRHDLAPQRIEACAQSILDGIHRGPCQEQALWVLEIAVAMLTGVMAVGREPLPAAEGLDPASYALSVLRDLQRAAADAGLDYSRLEAAAVQAVRGAEEGGHSNLETWWSLNRATALLELAWARARASDEGPDTTR